MAIDGDICFHSRRGSGRLLDIGCNEGQGLQIYKQNGFMAEGLELNERTAAEARKRGFRVFTDSLETFHPEQLYDVVVLSQVLEHSVNPKEMLTHVARILKLDGQVWISCPNVENWQRDVFGRYWLNALYINDLELSMISYPSELAKEHIDNVRISLCYGHTSAKNWR